MKVEKVARERWDDLDLVAVHTRRSIRGGVLERFYFDPSHGWVHHGSRRVMARGNGDEVNCHIAYDQDRTTPLKWEYKLLRQQSGNEQMLRTVNIVKYQKKQFPDSDFRLSQFGLPEPVGASQVTGSSSYIWLLGAAAGSAGLALVFRHLGRRDRSSAGPRRLEGNA
jgi:hypothetical protein